MKTEYLLAGLLSTLTITAAPPALAQDTFDGFLCCNMRTDGSWISDINYAESGKTTIPLGTLVKVTGYGRYRVYIEVDGKSQAIGNDYSRDIDLPTFAKRYVVAADPMKSLAKASEKIQRAAKSSRVTKGMTREQVAMAVGHPVSSENPHADSDTWRMWLWSFSEFKVIFDGAGRVREVQSDADTLSKVYLK